MALGPNYKILYIGTHDIKIHNFYYSLTVRVHTYNVLWVSIVAWCRPQQHDCCNNEEWNGFFWIF